MLEPKIAIQLKSLRQPFKKALQTAHELGAKAVEIDAQADIRPKDLTGTGVRQLKKMLEDLHLKVAAIGFDELACLIAEVELKTSVAVLTIAPMTFPRPGGAP